MTAATHTTGPASFRAMGTEVLVAGASPESLAAIVALFEERERIFSRFRADSEIRAVNATAAPVVGVSREFARALQRALDAARATGGLVDPTLGAALVAAGYDRDFAALAPRDDAVGPARRGRWPEVHVWGRVIGRPIGLELDLNGVVKGMAVDDAAALLPGRAGYPPAATSPRGARSRSRCPTAARSASSAAASRRAAPSSGAGGAAARRSTT
ncbi:MAG: FAD:protein FMN transferase [Thermoleophilia bacterium]